MPSTRIVVDGPTVVANVDGPQNGSAVVLLGPGAWNLVSRCWSFIQGGGLEALDVLEARQGTRRIITVDRHLTEDRSDPERTRREEMPD
jgi:hypothetical protein